MEIPIPTYYGDEICYVDGVKYAREVTRDVLRYRLHKVGFGSGETAFASQAYEAKGSLDSSHRQLLDKMSERPPAKVLDLGCSDGSLAVRLRALGHHVTGVDVVRHDGIEDAVDAFVQGDLDEGIPAEVGVGYDVVLAADVIEHVRDPDAMLRAIAAVLQPEGSLLASIPNIAHWYPRLRMVLGRFDYERRGILDEGHLRFFTRRSFLRRATRSGFVVDWEAATGLPIEVVDRGAGDGGRVGSSSVASLVRRIDRRAVRWAPNLFAYQYLFDLRPDPMNQDG